MASRVARTGSVPFGPTFATHCAEIWSRFAARIAPIVARILSRSGVRRGTVVDLGCGSGTLAAHLGARGYRVIGIDRSRFMLRLARRAAPAARFVAADFCQVRLPAADAVVSTFDSLNYVSRSSDLRRLFDEVAGALRPGGVFLFDILTPDEIRVGPSREDLAYRSSNAIVAVRIERRRRGGRIRHTVAPLPRLNAGPRPPPEVHEQRVFAPEAVDRWLRSAGLRARQLPGYPGLRGQPGRVVFVAVKGRGARVSARRSYPAPGARRPRAEAASRRDHAG